MKLGLDLKLPNMSDFDIDENLISTISSRYYDLNEINKIKLTGQTFSVFHTNIRSLSKHFDELHAQLNMLNIPFDIIGISESKQQVGKDFLMNIRMDGYSTYSQPSKSSCGGCVLYVNSRLDHHVRDDLSVIEDDYETIWIEINNRKAKICFVAAYIGTHLVISQILTTILVQFCKKYRRRINH